MRIVGLHRYPIKGCRATTLTSVEVDGRGFGADRCLMLVDGEGRFLSQREQPRLATIVPSITGDQIEIRAGDGPGLEHRIDPDGRRVQVQIWRDQVQAVDQGDRVAKWFSDLLGIQSRLVWFGPGSVRPLDRRFWSGAGPGATFVDGYPVLLTSESSLQALNAELESPVPMNRFRPSLVVEGGAAWEEDEWELLETGGIQFAVVKPCARCVVTTTDQTTGERNPESEPLRTLAQLRTVPGKCALFGQNLVPLGTGSLTVGDPIERLR